jgi:hypothetical protein
MELNKIYTRTTWNDAAEAINTNNLKINQAIEELRRQSGVAGDGSVTTEKIADGAVTNTKIYSRAVTTEKIADEAVTTQKIYSRAVTSDKIAEKAVTAEHIAQKTITEEHLSEELKKKINDDAGYVWAFKLENEVSQVAETTTQTTTTVYTRI